MKAERTISIVNGREILAAWLPGEPALIAEMSRLRWCHDYARVRELGLLLVELRTLKKGNVP
jgi:hypothetical protein